MRYRNLALAFMGAVGLLFVAALFVAASSLSSQGAVAAGYAGAGEPPVSGFLVEHPVEQNGVTVAKDSTLVLSDVELRESIIHIAPGGHLFVFDSTISVQSIVVEEGGFLFVDPTTIYLEGDMYINGTAVFDATTVYVNNSFDGEHNIYVNSTAILEIRNNSAFLSNNTYRYQFFMAPGSNVAVNDSIIADCGWDPSHPGLWVNTSATFRNVSFENNYVGMVMNPSPEQSVVAEDVTFINWTGASADAVWVYNGSLLFYNSTLPSANVTVYNGSVEWHSYLTVFVHNETGAGIKNVSVTCKDSAGGQLYNSLTNQTGYTQPMDFVVLEKNSTSEKDNNPINITANGTAKHTGYGTNTTTHTLNTSETVSIRLENIPPDVTIVNPVDGETITSSTYTIRVSTDADVVGVDCYYYVEGAWDYIGAASFDGTYWSLVWNVGGMDVTDLLFSANVTDGVLWTNATSGNITVDTVPPGIAITSPLAGETITGTYTITYNLTGGDITQVRFEYYNGTVWILIGDDPTIDGSYDWNTTGIDGNMTLRATATDDAGLTGTDTVSTVRVDNTPPSPVFVTPENDSGISGQYNITIRSDWDTANITLAYYHVSWSTWGYIGNATYDNNTGLWYFVWNTTAVGDMNDIEIWANATDTIGHTGSTRVVGVDVDNTPPSLSSPYGSDGINPLVLFNGSEWVRSVNVTITMNATDSGSGVVNMTIYYTTDGSTPTTSSQSVEMNVSGSQPKFTGEGVIPPASNGTTVKFFIIAVDNAGMSTQSSIFSYKVDGDAPHITLWDTPILENSSYLHNTTHIYSTTVDGYPALVVDGLYYSDLMGDTPVNFSIGGSAVDYGSGLDVATASSAFNDTQSNITSPTAWAWTYTVNASDGGNGTITVKIYDAVGNYLTIIYNYTEDLSPPAGNMSLTENSAYLYFSPWGGTNGTGVLWYGDTMPGEESFSVTVNASDSISGVYAVFFPAVFGENSTNDTTEPHKYTYTINATDTYEGNISLVIYDNVGNHLSITFVVKRDTSPPAYSDFSVNETTDYTWWNPPTFWYGDTIPSPVDMNVTITAPVDADSGLRHIFFPAIFNLPENTTTLPYRTYTISANDTDEGWFNITIYDNVNHTTVIPLRVQRDTTYPVVLSDTAESPSPWIYIENHNIIYGDGMDGAPQEIYINGTADDGGSGLWKIVFSPAFNDTPPADYTPPSWNATYTVESADNGSGTITLEIWDHVGHVTTIKYNYTEDLVPPGVVSVTLNRTSPLTTGWTKITILFSERMKTDAQPAVEWVQASPPYTPRSINGTWVDEYTWEGTFYISAAVENTWYNISVSGAKDLVSNQQVPWNQTLFYVDTVAENNTLTSPANDTVLRDIFTVTYYLGENASCANITFYRASGASDSLSPHVYVLTGDNLTAGLHALNMSTLGMQLVDGTYYTITLYSTDVAGNPAAPVSVYNILVDRTPPTTTAQVQGVLGASGWYISAVNISFTVTDNSSTTTWYSTDGGATWHTYTSPINLTTSGTYTISYNSTDIVGNTETTHTLTIKVDVDMPVTTITPVGPGASGWYISVHLNITGSDQTSGVNATFYRINNATWQQYTAPFNLTEGVYYLEAYTTDMAGNTGPTTWTVIHVDSTPPTLQTNVSGTVINTWYNPNATIYVNATDNLSGVDHVEVRIDGGSWTTYTSPVVLYTTGIHQVEMRAFDMPGNVEYANLTVKVDNTPPSTTPLINGTAGQNGWYTANVTITLTASDGSNTSGVAETYYTVDGGGWYLYTAQFKISGDGVHTVEFYSTDNANNTETSHTLTIMIDTTPPTASFSITGNMSNGWYNTSVNITATVEEPTSTPASLYYAVDGSLWQKYTGPIVITADGEHIFQYYTKNSAGLTSEVETFYIKIDRTPPTTAISATGTLGNSGWYTDQTTLSIDGTDDLSGTAKTFYRINNATWLLYNATTPPTLPLTGESGGIYYVEAYSTDLAGNTGNTSSLIIKVDTTKPETEIDINATAGNNGWYTSPVNITLTATDTFSGMSAGEIYYRLNGQTNLYTGPFTVETDGNNTLEYWAVDTAGNKEARHTMYLLIDTSPPSQPSFYVTGQIGENGWYTSNVSVVISNGNDPLGGSGYNATEYRVYSPGNSSVPWTPYTDTLTLQTEGIYIVEARGVDNAGNPSATSSVTIKIDLAAPHVEINVVGFVGENSWYITYPEINLTAWDTNTNATTPVLIEYSVDGSPWTLYTGNFSITTDGAHSVDFRATDEAGWTTANSTTLYMDTVPPAISTISAPTYTATPTINVTLGANDDTSGLSEIRARTNTTQWTPWTPYTDTVQINLTAVDGPYTIYVEIKDRAGHNTTATATTALDTTPPAGNISTPALTNTTSITVWYNTTDATSGIAETYIEHSADGTNWTSTPVTASPVVISVEKDGQHFFRLRAVDVVGNVFVSDVFTTVVDTASPHATISISPGLSPIGETTITVAYSETMDTATPPTAVFFFSASPENPTPITGNWLNTTTWVGHITVDQSFQAGIYTVKIAGARDTAGNVQMEARENWTVDPIKPEVAGTSPDNIVFGPGGVYVNITFSESVNTTTASFYLNTTAETIPASFTQTSSNTVMVHLVPSATQNGPAHIYMRGIYDFAGNPSGGIETGAYEIDQTPPQATGAVLVDDTTVEVYFTEKIDPESADPSDFVPSSGTVENISIAQNRTAVYLSIMGYKQGTSGTLSISGISDTYGNSLEIPQSLIIFDRVPPRFESAKTTSLTTIKVVWSEPLNETTSTAEDFLVIFYDETNASATVQPYMASTSGNTTTLYIAETMETWEKPTVKLVGVVEDTSGNPLAGGENESVEIRCDDGIPPTLLWARTTTTTTITIQFSENIAPVTAGMFSVYGKAVKAVQQSGSVVILTVEPEMKPYETPFLDTYTGIKDVSGNEMSPVDDFQVEDGIPNIAPTLTSPSPQSATIYYDENITISVVYRDPDGDPPSWVVAKTSSGETMANLVPQGNTYEEGVLCTAEIALPLGEHTLYFSASDGNLTSTSDSIKVTVTERPVREINVSISPAAMEVDMGQENHTTHAVVTVENAGNTECDIFLNVTAFSGWTVTGAGIYHLEVGESENINVYITPGDGTPGGTYRITVSARPVQGGNIKYTTANVTVRRGEPSIDGITVTGPTVGQVETITVNISNRGDGALPTSRLTLYAGGEILGTVTVAPLGPGETREIVFHWVPSGAGETPITATLDSEGEKTSYTIYVGVAEMPLGQVLKEMPENPTFWAALFVAGIFWLAVFLVAYYHFTSKKEKRSNKKKQ